MNSLGIPSAVDHFGAMIQTVNAIKCTFVSVCLEFRAMIQTVNSIKCTFVSVCLELG